MKTITLYTLILLFFTLVNCKKSDESAPLEIMPQDEPPLSFNLVDVPNDAIDVDLIPTLSWESAKNSKGNKVTYELYLGEESNPSNLYVEKLETTSFELTERLHLHTNYFWKVIATDAQGQTARSPIQKFRTRDVAVPSSALNQNAAFPKRGGHTLSPFNGKLWLIGGSVGQDIRADAWSSENGNDWSKAAENLPFSDRTGHSTVVFNDQLYVIGRLLVNRSDRLIWSGSSGSKETRDDRAMRAAAGCDWIWEKHNRIDALTG